MKLHELKPIAGSNTKPHRKGRGIAAGKGKTSGRGSKGQNSRSGGGTRPGFEGGQNPWFRRIPKRGFKNINHINYQVVNLFSLNNKYNNGEVVDIISLFKKRLISKKNIPVKILAQGKLEKKLTIHVDKISQKAKELIINAGGKVISN